MIIHADLTGINKQFRDCDFAYASNPLNGADAAALAETVKNVGAFGGREFVHEAEYTASC
jgi:hypothetical protein